MNYVGFRITFNQSSRAVVAFPRVHPTAGISYLTELADKRQQRGLTSSAPKEALRGPV